MEMKSMDDWTTCEGSSNAYSPGRRAAIGAALAGAIALWAGSKSALAQVSVDVKKRQDRDVLVTIFLRGGMDGLSALVPHADDEYHKARPTLSMGKPKAGGVVDLDGFYGLHPALSPLESLYKEGKLAGIHAVGSLDQTRSHFEAMGTMERGAAKDPAEIPSGWLGRALAATDDTENRSPLRAVAFAPVMPDILRGGTTATAIDTLESLRLELPQSASKGLEAALTGLYAKGDGQVERAGRETLAVLETLKRLHVKDYKPERGAIYPETKLGDGLKQTALLIKADVGLEAAALDRGGWDSHVAQGGYLSGHFDDVGKSLAAFASDLGPALDRVTCVVMTEFGRRVAENSGLGTDHGRGSCWLVLGGHLQQSGGGKIHGKWPSLDPAKLEDPGDLPVTTDYRDVLAEILTRRLKIDGRAVFPGAPGKFPNIV